MFRNAIHMHAGHRYCTVPMVEERERESEERTPGVDPVDGSEVRSLVVRRERRREAKEEEGEEAASRFIRVRLSSQFFLFSLSLSCAS